MYIFWKPAKLQDLAENEILSSVARAFHVPADIWDPPHRLVWILTKLATYKEEEEGYFFFLYSLPVEGSLGASSIEYIDHIFDGYEYMMCNLPRGDWFATPVDWYREDTVAGFHKAFSRVVSEFNSLTSKTIIVAYEEIHRFKKDLLIVS